MLGLLLRTPGARVVTVSSFAHRSGKMRFDDLQRKQSYNRFGAYGQSKLANLLFAFEFEARLRALGTDVRSLAAHPGYSATNLQRGALQREQMTLLGRAIEKANQIFAQSAEMGAWPSLRAGTDLDAAGGTYFGPSGFSEMWGAPEPVRGSAAALDRDSAKRLWEVSEALTGVRYSEFD
jgi:NAD(P)-dependent dehydrogenase (short-subunit alcohol dehydrogenase family)